MRKIAAFVVLAFAVAASGQAPEVDGNQEIRPYLTPEAYEIYAILFPKDSSSKGHRRLVILQETQAAPFPAPLRDCLLGLDVRQERGDQTLSRSVIEDFHRVNQVPKLLVEGQLQSVASHTLADRSAIEQSFNGGIEQGWREFYRRFPMSSGYSVVSAVGFNEAKTQALVYLEHHCGGLCGFAEVLLLEKMDGKWQEVPHATGCGWKF